MIKFKKIFLALGLIIILSITGFYLYAQPRYVLPILMYHHIGQGSKDSSLSVSPENFRRQIHLLSRGNYNVISLNELVQAIKKGKSLPRNSAVITFDDGYEDNYTYAYPVLKEYNLPATIFVIVESVGQPGYLTHQQLEAMAASGIIDIGSHSLKGAYLPGKNRQELEREIGSSKKILKAWLGKEINLFCYPIGGFTVEIQELLKQYGYKAACTTNRGNKKTYLNDDIFALKRIKVKDGFANLFVFRVKLSGYYNSWRRVRNPY